MEFVDGMFIPSSITHTIHYYLLSGASEKDLVHLMDREKVFFFIKYMLEKRLGKILSLKFTVSIAGDNIVIKLKRVQTPSHVYDVDGRIVIDPHISSITLSVHVKTAYHVRGEVKKYLEDGVVHMDSGDVEVRFYT